MGGGSEDWRAEGRERRTGGQRGGRQEDGEEEGQQVELSRGGIYL